MTYFSIYAFSITVGYSSNLYSSYQKENILHIRKGLSIYSLIDIAFAIRHLFLISCFESVHKFSINCDSV